MSIHSNKCGSYKEFLIESIKNYKGDFNKIIYYTPYLFSLLCDLLDDENLTKDMKHLINAALAYFVTPVDVIPEEIYGPYGYIDDIFLCSYVLNKLKDRLTIDKIEQYWELEEDFIVVLENCLEVSRKVIEEKNLKNEIFKYVGLE